MTTGKQERLVYIDVLRAVAIIGVVVIHGVDQILQYTAQKDTLVWWYANLFNSSVRWTLPAFFMISGVLLLSKQEPLNVFLTKRVKRILIPLIVWSSLYGLWSWFNYNPGLTIKDQLIATLVYGNPYYHLYFLFAITGFYLINPIFSLFVQHASQRRFLYAVIVFLAIGSFANMTVSWFMQVYPGSRLVSIYQWLPFAGYYLAGLYLHRYALPLSTKTILVLLTTLVILAGVGTYGLTGAFGHGPRGVLLQDYLSLNVIAVSLLIFTLFTRLKETHIPTWLMPWIKRLAAASFGIYLVHLMLMESLGRYLSQLPGYQTSIGYNLLLTGATLVGSFMVTKLIALLPGVKKAVGF